MLTFWICFVHLHLESVAANNVDQVTINESNHPNRVIRNRRSTDNIRETTIPAASSVDSGWFQAFDALPKELTEMVASIVSN